MPILIRVNERGEVLDADGKVVGRVVPVELTDVMLSRMWLAVAGSIVRDHSAMRYTWSTLLSVAPADWSHVAVQLPERKTIPANNWMIDACLAQAVKRCVSEIDCGCACRPAVLAALAESGDREAKWLCTQTAGDCLALQAASIRAAFPEAFK